MNTGKQSKVPVGTNKSWVQHILRGRHQTIPVPLSQPYSCYSTTTSCRKRPLEASNHSRVDHDDDDGTSSTSSLMNNSKEPAAMHEDDENDDDNDDDNDDSTATATTTTTTTTTRTRTLTRSSAHHKIPTNDHTAMNITPLKQNQVTSTISPVDRSTVNSNNSNNKENNNRANNNKENNKQQQPQQQCSIERSRLPQNDHNNTSNHSLEQGVGDIDQSEHSRQRKRLRVDSRRNRSSHPQGVNDATTISESALLAQQKLDAADLHSRSQKQKQRRRRRKQINYYRKCHREEDEPPPSIRYSRTSPSIPASKFDSFQQHQERYQLLASSRIMVVAWMAKLGQEYQHCQVIQSPMYRLLQIQMQRALLQQQTSQQPTSQHRQSQPRIEHHQHVAEEESQSAIMQSQSTQQSQDESSPSRDVQKQQQQQQQQLRRECTMWQTQNKQLQKDYQKERNSKRTLEQENQKLLQTVKALKGKYKKLKTKQKKDYQTLATGGGGGANAKELFSSSPLTPTSSTTTTNNNNSNSNCNKKFDDASKGKGSLVPRRLESDYFTPPTTATSTRRNEMAAQGVTEKRNPATIAASTSTIRHPAAPNSTDTLSPPLPTVEILHQDGQSDSRDQDTSNTNQQQDSTLVVDYCMPDNRVPPPPSSAAQASTAFSKATEWPKNNCNTQQQLQQLQHTSVTKEKKVDPTRESTSSSTAAAAAAQTDGDTQATYESAPSSIPPSANLLSDTATNTELYTPKPPHTLGNSMEAAIFGSPSTVQPLAKLSQGTETEIYAPPPMPPPLATDYPKKEATSEKGLECEIQAESPRETTIIPPPPPTPKASTAVLSFVDSPPDVHEASQTTFHDGMTNPPRPKGTLMTHPAHIRLNLLPPPPKQLQPSMPGNKNPQGAEASRRPNNDEPPTQHGQSQNPRRVTLSPHTKPIQLSPFGLTQKSSNRSTTTQRNHHDRVPESRTLTRNLPARSSNSGYYTGFARNLYLQKAQDLQMPDSVPSDSTAAVVDPTITEASRIFPGSQGKSLPVPTSKLSEPTTKSTPSSFEKISSPTIPMEQPWIQNRHYNDFMEDSPPSVRHPTAARLSEQPKQYTRKVMGGPGNRAAPSNGVRYQEVVRNKAEREMMISTDCPDCAGFLDQLERDGYQRDEMRCMCRHKTRYTPPETPPNFWELSFVDEIKERQAKGARAGNRSEEHFGTTQDI